MDTYILKETQTEDYYKFVIKHATSLEHAKLLSVMMGLPNKEIKCCECLEELKSMVKVGDCICIEYDGKLIPFQVLHKYPDNRCVLSSYYVLENHIFDEKTNVWRDSSIRRYMNGEMAAKFDPEMVSKYIKETDVHTDNYVTKDKFWLLSHEEIGYKDTSNMFKKNIGAITFDYYKDSGEKPQN